jgi:hypothetical protein
MRASQRHALGALFIFLAAVFAGVAYAAGHAAVNRPGLWAVVIAAAALSLWLVALAIGALR